MAKKLFSVKISFDIVVYSEPGQEREDAQDFFLDAARDLSPRDLDLIIRPYPNEGYIGVPYGWTDGCLPYGHDVNDRTIGELK